MTLLIELAVKSTVVAGATLALLALVGRRSAAERSCIAHAAFVVLAGLPAAVLLLPRWRLAPPVETAPAFSTLPTAPAPAAAGPAIDPALWLQVVYAGGAALLLLATVVAVLRLVALRRGAAVLADPHWLTALARAQRRMKVRSGAALLVSTALTSPVSWGLLKPTIVVNQGLVASKDDAEAVIAHELAHVVRRDWAKLIGVRLVTALFWFNPLVWVLAGQCHQLREEAADDAVLGAQVPSADYASLLVEAARHQALGLAAVHGVAPGRGSLHRRVSRVLDAAARRTPTRGAWAVGVAALAVLFAGPLAALTLEPAEAIPAVEGVPAEPVAVGPRAAAVTGASREKTTPARTVAAIRAAPAAAPEGLPLAKGKLALGEPGAPKLAVTARAPADPRTPKVAIAAAAGSDPSVTVFGKPGGKLRIGDWLTLTGPGEWAPRIEGGKALTLGDRAEAPGSSNASQTADSDANASSSGAHTLTTDGKTVRIETQTRTDPADRGPRVGEQRARLLEAEAEKRAREREAQAEQRERLAEQRARIREAQAEERARTIELEAERRARTLEAEAEKRALAREAELVAREQRQALAESQAAMEQRKRAASSGP